MAGSVDADAAISLAFTAYESGKREVMSEPQRIRMNVAINVPFDFILHGEMTPEYLRRAASLLCAVADILCEDAQPTPHQDQSK